MVDGLSGAMIGSNTNGQNLDDPALEPVWAEAERLGAFLLVHPVKVAGIDRQRSYYLQNFVGNPLDTTIAAACLVFGGVLERHPGLKVTLSHGGGFVPIRRRGGIHGWAERDEAKARLKGEQVCLDRLYFDAILHDAAPLQFLVDWALQAGHARLRLSVRHGPVRPFFFFDGLRLTDAARRDVFAAAAEALVPGA